MTYKELKAMLEQIPENHLNDDVTVAALNDTDDGEVYAVVDFVIKWPDEFNSENIEDDTKNEDFFSKGVDVVDGILDEDHPYFTVNV